MCRATDADGATQLPGQRFDRGGFGNDVRERGSRLSFPPCWSPGSAMTPPQRRNFVHRRLGAVTELSHDCRMRPLGLECKNKRNRGARMLVLDRVTRRFGATVAVSDVSIEIQPGSFVGVIGRSGAGKSTLLRMINRLVEPTEGRIVFDGVDVTSLQGRHLRRMAARRGHDLPAVQSGAAARRPDQRAARPPQPARNAAVAAQLLYRCTSGPWRVESLERLDI